MHDFQDKLHTRIVRLSQLTLVAAGFAMWQLSSRIFQLLDPDNWYNLAGVVHTGLPIASVIVMIATVLWILSQSASDINRVKLLAFVDELTGLPNRRNFNTILEKELLTCLNGKKQVAVLYFDLDRFKIINDCHGHEAGDAVIKVFGQRISDVIRGDDLVARLSGDEFAAIVTDVSSEEDLEKVARRVLAAMKEPILYQGKNLYVGVSIGASVIDDSSVDAVEAMRRADFALLHAKDTGRNQMVMFDPEMAEKIKSKSALESDLREAIRLDQLQIRYQPLINHADQDIVGVEALLRWQHPIKGMISPDIFIPLAEEIGVIDQLGDFVLKKACEDIKPINSMKLAVNVSPMQLLQDGFADVVQNILLQTGFEPTRLELEITEGVLISTPEATSEVLNQLRRIGVRIALDDFGTGFSSMSYLRDYPLDRIKIDRSFIDGMDDSDKSFGFVSKMIELGSSLGMKVTVEGIETEQQMLLMQQSECTELQGFYFSKPLSADELLECELIIAANDQTSKEETISQLRLVN